MSNYLWQYPVRGACTFASVPQIPGILILSQTEHIYDADDSVRARAAARRRGGKMEAPSMESTTFHRLGLSKISPVSGAHHTALIVIRQHCLGIQGVLVRSRTSTMSYYLWQYQVRGACTFASVPQVPGILILSPTKHIRCFLHAQDADAR
ncbi:hypothetical protein DFH06DRAFT_1321850 [Mycena polygramma]|nr:hypothetical protein DFH06DRAFT_1321850 [Mycena polygramma]